MFDVNHIVQAGGLLVVTLIVFAESGIFLGFFLPGDSLLLTAGLLAGKDYMSIEWLVVLVILAAIVGYQIGYMFGEKAGPKLFKRKTGILFREDYIEKTNKYFKKYGPATVVLGRFIPHVRSFISVIAGAGGMDKRKYFVYNVIGAFLWAGGITLVGYWLGSSIHDIDKYFFPVIISALVIFYVVALWSLVKSPARRSTLKKGLKEDFDYFFRGVKE